MQHDMVNHPKHYTSHPKGIEAIEVIEEADRPNLANTIKYVWRVLWGSKGRDLEDLKKARWYLDREIGRMEAKAEPVVVIKSDTSLSNAAQEEALRKIARAAIAAGDVAKYVEWSTEAAIAPRQSGKSAGVEAFERASKSAAQWLRDLGLRG